MPIIETAAATGQFPYVVSHNPDGTVWNKTLNAGAGGWQAFSGGNWAQYALPLTEQGTSGYYSAPYPTGIVGVLTTEVLYFNATPTLGDAPGGIVQSLGVNVAAVDGDATVAPKLQRSASSMVVGKVIAGTLTDVAFSTDLENPNPNAFQGRSLLFPAGTTLEGQGGVISAYDPDTGIITVTAAFTGAPAVDDTFVIS